MIEGLPSVPSFEQSCLGQTRGDKPVRRVLHCSCQRSIQVPLCLLSWIWLLLVYEKQLASYRLTFIPKSASTFKVIPELK